MLLVDWAKGRLAASGLGDVDFTVEGLALDRLSLSNIRFGSSREQRLERLTVFFRPLRLLRSHLLDRVLIESADLRFIRGDDSVPRLAGVSLPETSGTEACLKVPAIPVTRFELRTSRLNLETGTGALRIPLRGTMTQADGRAWMLDAQLGVRYRDAHGELALQAQLAPDGTLEAELDLSGAEGWLPGGLDTLGGGRFTLEWDGCKQLSGTGSLALLLAGSPVALDVQDAKAGGEGEALAFAVDLDASDLDLAVLGRLAGFDTGLKGRTSLQARLEGALPVLSERLLEEASANGRVSLQIKEGTFPGWAAETPGEVALDVRADKTQGEALAFGLDLDTSDLDLAVLDGLAGFDTGLKGRASLQARLEGALPILSERLLEAASANGRVSLHIEDGTLPGWVAKTPGEVALDVRADKTQGEALAFGLDLDTSRLDLAALGKLAGFGAGLDGRASLQARIEGALPILPERLLEAASASGRVSLHIENGALPDLVAGVSSDVAVDLSLSDASLLAELTSPWKVTGRLLSLDPAATFRLSAVTGHGLRFTSSTGLARWTAAGPVDFVLESPSWPRLAGTASGRVEQAPEDGLRFDLKRLQLAPTNWTRDGMEIRVKALNAQLAGTVSRMQGQASARFDAFDDAVEGRLSGGEVELRGRLTQADGGLLLAVEDCISVAAKRLELKAVRWLRPVDLCVRQTEGRPLLRLDPTRKTWSLALTLPSHPVVLAVEHEQNPAKLAGTMPQVSLSATFDPTAKAPGLALHTQGGRLELSEQAVAVSDLELSLLQDQTASITLKNAVADSLAIPPDFPALALTGKADGQLDGTMKFTLAAQGREVPLKLSAKGEHDVGLAIGELSYELDKIRFAPQGLQPGDLVPAVREFINKARGSLAMSGGLSWVAGVPATYLRLALRDLGFDAAGLAVRGINTRFERAGRTVRNRLATQEIRVDLLDIGIPLRNGLIRFHTRKAPAVHFEQVRFAWGDGSVGIEPFAVRLDRLAAEHAIVLTCSEIGLNALFDLISIDGLEGTGSLGGRVPLHILGSEVTIDQGSISTEAPGVLRYRPREKPAFFKKNSQTELLFEALQNFHYESLSIGVNGRTHDNLQLSISLAGANPDLYDGHPFKLNFNIGGELDTIVQRNLSIATFAERFGELMSRYLR